VTTGLQFHTYQPENGPFYDELLEDVGRPRRGLEPLIEGINALDEGALRSRQQAAEHTLMSMGITFTLTGDEGESAERIFPFDIVPRVILPQEWARLEQGIKQRQLALNLFLSDVYGEKKIIKDGVIPGGLIETSAEYLPQCEGLKPPRGIWCHVGGTDLVRDKDGQFYVLEDNLRCPSGVSYVLENREIVKRTFPKVFQAMSIRPVDDYPTRLLGSLRYLAADRVDEPRVVVLTPGRYNSAYFEHCYLAQQMGVELVESQDLIVTDGYVHMRTTRGLVRVDVIYRRVSDEFLDPLTFNPTSLLGVPGVFKAYQEGKVALANAPGAGIADDKAIYAYVTKMIRYYLDEEAIIPNVPTYLAENAEDRGYILSHLEKLVVKTTDGAGGYGMLVGPHSSKEEQADFAERIRRNPRGYIAQPTLTLSRSPTIIDEKFAPRHVDLRPFSLHGEDLYVQPGGLTRVALKEGSLVVNSSQGGGSKDTWVLAE
jgi:uncharacterized circularly permuted ATP-grasp superfamily protein